MAQTIKVLQSNFSIAAPMLGFTSPLDTQKSAGKKKAKFFH